MIRIKSTILINYIKRQFLLRDTRSSNGTFINNHRLSPANEDSPAEELFSGDIVQFGVEVMESAKKMTHGCIVLCIKLYYPNGEEAIRPPNHISNHIMMPSNLLFEPSTFMQQDVTVIPDQASMLPFMFSDNRVDMFLGPTNNNNNINNNNQSADSASSLNGNNTGSSSSVSAINRTYLATFFNKNIRPNKSTINDNGSNLARIGFHETGTILKKHVDHNKDKIDRSDMVCNENYVNSTSSNFNYFDHTQGSNNVINQQQSFCPPTTSNNDQSNNNGINMMGVVSSYYCETINFFTLLKEAAQREQQIRQKLQLVEQTLEEAHLAADRGWKACIKEDLLLSKIETLQKKLEFLMRASKVAKSKQALKENSRADHEPQDNASEPNLSTNDTKAIECVNKITSNESETINDLEQQLKEKVLNYIDDKANYELIAKDAIKKALQKEYLAFRRIHDLEVLLKSSEEQCQSLKESNVRLEQLNTSKDVAHQKQSEEMTQEKLILIKDIDELKQANSQLSKQYENAIHESKRKIDEFEHRLEFASQQICDIQLKDKQLDNLRYQLMVVNSLYTQADENNQHLKQEVR